MGKLLPSAFMGTPSERAKLSTWSVRAPIFFAAWLAVIAAAGLDARTRPEEIPVQLWQQLTVPKA